MSKTWVILACVLSLPLGAQSPRERASEPPAQASQHEQHSQAEAAEQPRGMQEHMAAMREQMARIQAAENPEERERLMREHMQSMHEHMAMMGRMGQGGSGNDALGRTSCAQRQMMEHGRESSESDEGRDGR